MRAERACAPSSPTRGPTPARWRWPAARSPRRPASPSALRAADATARISTNWFRDETIYTMVQTSWRAARPPAAPRHRRIPPVRQRQRRRPGGEEAHGVGRAARSGGAGDVDDDAIERLMAHSPDAGASCASSWAHTGIGGIGRGARGRAHGALPAAGGRARRTARATCENGQLCPAWRALHRQDPDAFRDRLGHLDQPSAGSTNVSLMADYRVRLGGLPPVLAGVAWTTPRGRSRGAAGRLAQEVEAKQSPPALAHQALASYQWRSVGLVRGQCPPPPRSALPALALVGCASPGDQRNQAAGTARPRHRRCVGRQHEGLLAHHALDLAQRLLGREAAGRQALQAFCTAASYRLVQALGSAARGAAWHGAPTAWSRSTCRWPPR